MRSGQAKAKGLGTQGKSQQAAARRRDPPLADLGQGCKLILVNPSASPASAHMTVTRSDLTWLPPMDFQAAGRSVLEHDLCGHDGPGAYGTVELQARNPLVGAVIREGLNDGYRFYTELR